MHSFSSLCILGNIDFSLENPRPFSAHHIFKSKTSRFSLLEEFLSRRLFRLITVLN